MFPSDISTMPVLLRCNYVKAMSMHEDKYTYPSNVLHSNIPQESYPTWILMTQMHVATYCGGGGVFAVLEVMMVSGVAMVVVGWAGATMGIGPGVSNFRMVEVRLAGKK